MVFRRQGNGVREGGEGKVEFTGRKRVIREGVNGAMDQDVAIDWASLWMV